MMRKLFCLLIMLLMFLPMVVITEDNPKYLSYIEESLPDNPLWTAGVCQVTGLRIKKNLESKEWLIRINIGDVVDVYYWSEKWCVVGFQGEIGYMPTERLTVFRQLTRVPLPGLIQLEGIATIKRTIHLDVNGYQGGNDANAGTLICTQKSGLCPMMRATVQLPKDSFTFEPFVTPEDSKPGDALYGVTTFYNDSLGGYYPENRVFNIELAVKRLQGVIIGVGEKFSFNRYCGPYTQKNGYAMAKNVSKDGYGYGGGVCQVSTTIFNAIMPLAHTLDEWLLHSYSGVKYIPRNLDAAVASSRDFSFYKQRALSPGDVYLCPGWCADGYFSPG